MQKTSQCFLVRFYVKTAADSIVPIILFNVSLQLFYPLSEATAEG